MNNRQTADCHPRLNQAEFASLPHFLSRGGWQNARPDGVARPQSWSRLVEHGHPNPGSCRLWGGLQQPELLAIHFWTCFKRSTANPAAASARLAIGTIPAWMSQHAIGTARGVGFGRE